MRLNNIVTFCLFMFFITTSSFAITSNEVATIDMSLAISLHPKMALYDYNRMGFYKVKLGLSNEDFIKAIEELKKSPKDIKAEKEKLDSELKNLLIERNEYNREFFLNHNEITKEYQQKIDYYNNREEEIKTIIKDLDWGFKNPELTSREETRSIMKEIKNEIYEAIKQIVEEKKYILVLNSYIFTARKNTNDFTDFVQLLAMPGLNYNIYYAFYLKTLHNNNSDSNIKSLYEKNWFDLTSDDTFPISNYPIVLSGGNNILPEVIKKVYLKYNVDSNTCKMIVSVTERIECLQQGKQIEKLEVILDEK